MKNVFIILSLVFCSFASQAQHNAILDSIEQKLRMSEGVERCQQLTKLFRAFENQPDAGSIPFPESYYTYVDECIPVADSMDDIDLLNSLKISKAALLLREDKHLHVFNLITEVLASQQALSLYDSLDAYVFLSGSYHELGLHNKALELAPIKSQIAKSLNRSDVVSELNSEIASTYYKLMVFDLAAFHFKELVDDYIDEKNWYMVAAHYSNLGLSYNGWGKPDSALLFYNLAKKYAYRHYENGDNELEKEYFLGFIDGNSAEVYINNGLLIKGIELATKDIRASRKFGNFTNVSNRQLLIAKAYQLLNDPTTALAFVDSAAKILSSKGLMTQKMQVKIGGLKAHLLFNLKDYEQASILFHNINELSDSLQNKENAMNALISNSAFQVYQKESELKLHKANLIEAETRHKLDVQQRNILYLLVTILFIFAGLSFLAFKQKIKGHRLLKSQKQEIESQKKLIESNLDEKELLLKEIQHRVKNNLQVISGMMQLQASNFNDPDVCRVMEEGQARIKAMAIIHQQLYQNNDNLRYISFNLYLKNLTTQIAGSYKRISKNVTITIDAGNIQFDVKTAIPLGIIINELLSNAYKYAFNESKQGSINISIHPKGDHEYTLIVKDNGIGLPKDFNLNNVNSLGLKLVKILSKQMRGSFDFKNGEGTSFIISFKDNATV